MTGGTPLRRDLHSEHVGTAHPRVYTTPTDCSQARADAEEPALIGAIGYGIGQNNAAGNDDEPPARTTADCMVDRLTKSLDEIRVRAMSDDRRRLVLDRVRRALHAPGGNAVAVERARLRLLGQHATAELAERANTELPELLARLLEDGPR